MHIYLCIYTHKRIIYVYRYVHTYVYMHVYLYMLILHIYKSTYIHIYMYINLHIHTNTSVSVYIYTYIYVYVYIYICTYIYICMYIYIYICIYICMYVYIYIYIYIYTYVYLSQKVKNRYWEPGYPLHTPTPPCLTRSCGGAVSSGSGTRCNTLQHTLQHTLHYIPEHKALHVSPGCAAVPSEARRASKAFLSCSRFIFLRLDVCSYIYMDHIHIGDVFMHLYES